MLKSIACSMHSPQSIISKIQINIGLYVYIYLIKVSCNNKNALEKISKITQLP